MKEIEKGHSCYFIKYAHDLLKFACKKNVPTALPQLMTTLFLIAVILLKEHSVLWGKSKAGDAEIQTVY